MEFLEKTRFSAEKQKTLKQETDKNFEENFKPVGAIAFFFLLVTLGLIIWFSIYFLMLERI